jgi:translation initiation factor 4A
MEFADDDDDGFLVKKEEVDNEVEEDFFQHSGKGEFQEIKSFDELDITPELLRGIYSMGYETPSAIQKKAIVPILARRDVIAQSQSGTGKTLSFCIGGLALLDLSQNSTQLLILSPTRELTLQIAETARNISAFQKDLKIKTLVGGNSVQEDLFDLKTDVYHAIVGCPGRVTDIIRRKAIQAHTIRVFIMDEADEMLNKGFKDQIHEIFQNVSPDVQSVLFSATMPQETLDITKKFMRDPVVISMKTEHLSLEGIDQYFIPAESDSHKYNLLLRLFRSENVKQCIIYANSVDRVKYMDSLLLKDGFSVEAIHSELDKMQREKILNRFKAGESRTLVSTDLTARGIDVQQVSMVINFDVPRDENVYLHRIGRSGRWGRKGLAINLVTQKDNFMMKKISLHYKKPILEYKLPLEDI